MTKLVKEDFKEISRLFHKWYFVSSGKQKIGRLKSLRIRQKEQWLELLWKSESGRGGIQITIKKDDDIARLSSRLWKALRRMEGKLERIPVKIKKEPLAEKLISFLPEDYQGELQALRERWKKRNYSPRDIRWLTYKQLFFGYLCLVQIKLENLRLPQHNTSKEIE